MAFVSRWRSPRRLAAGFRLVFGAALWLSAPESRHPLVLRGVAVVSLAAALSVPLLGASRAEAFVGWWSSRSAAFIRCWSFVAVVFGLYLLWTLYA